MGTTDPIAKPVLFFDGVCNLCNESVQFIIKRDSRSKFHFSSLQSDYAKENLPKELTEDDNLQSLVLKTGEHIKTKSSAVLEVVRHLGGLWPMVYVFVIVPKPIRDFFYSWVARNRYKWFGRKNECMIPSAQLKSRFIE